LTPQRNERCQLYFGPGSSLTPIASYEQPIIVCIAIILCNIGPMKKTLILVADDDSDDRFLLQTAFNENGGQETLQFVENGIEVLQFLNAIAADDNESCYPELIILDLNMPKKSGKEVLAELKQHPIYKKIPVIIYTTTRNELEIKRCYELGANTYIVKPISFEALREIVGTIRSYWMDTASIPALNE
jgi:CheY-like chemotaxis protein